jgi:hypothetical protein
MERIDELIHSIAEGKGISEVVNEAIAQATPPAPKEQHIRAVTITIVGPEAGPIAAGLTTALAKVARDVEARHQNTKARVTSASQ